MAVSVEVAADRLVLGAPQDLFHIKETIVSMDAAADHRRLLVATRDQGENEPLYVVLNWLRELE